MEWLDAERPGERKNERYVVPAQFVAPEGVGDRGEAAFLRRGEYASARWAAALDWDGGDGADWEAEGRAALEALEMTGVAHVWHTTWSRTEENFRFRVWVPLSRAVGPEEWPAVLADLRAVLGGSGWDTNADDFVRIMFAPAAERRGLYEWGVGEGGAWPVPEVVDEVEPVDDWDGTVPYTGPVWGQMSPEEKEAAQAVQDAEFAAIRKQLDEASLWDEGERNDAGKGWHELVRDAVLVAAKWHLTPWAPLSEEGLEQFVAGLIPEEMAAACSDDMRTGDNTVRRAAESLADDGALRMPAALRLARVQPDEVALCTNDSEVVDWLLDQAEGELIYQGGRWLTYADGCWAETWSKDAGVYQWVRPRVAALCSEIALAMGGDKQLQAQLRRMQTTGYVGRIAGELAGLLEKPKGMEFNADVDLLCCANGIVNVTTGELTPHDPEQYMTQTTGIDYVPGRWRGNRVVEAIEGLLDEEELRWVQGRLREMLRGVPSSTESVLFLHGEGSNGKSTLIDAVNASLGDYSTTVGEDVLVGNSQFASAILEGKRLAFLEELPEKRLNSRTVKTLTGSELRVERKGKDARIVRAQHSVVVSTNNDLEVEGNEHGLWRRIDVLPFTRTFSATTPEAEVLKNRVRAMVREDREAVLSWVMAGDREAPAPASLTEARQAQLEASDAIGTFLEEVCQPGGMVVWQQLRERFIVWQRANGVRNTWTPRQFSSRFFRSPVVREWGIKKEMSGRNVGRQLRNPKKYIESGELRWWDGHQVTEEMLLIGDLPERPRVMEGLSFA